MQSSSEKRKINITFHRSKRKGWRWAQPWPHFPLKGLLLLIPKWKGEGWYLGKAKGWHLSQYPTLRLKLLLIFQPERKQEQQGVTAGCKQGPAKVRRTPWGNHASHQIKQNNKQERKRSHGKRTNTFFLNYDKHTMGLNTQTWSPLGMTKCWVMCSSRALSTRSHHL